MNDNLEEQAYRLLGELGKISAHLLMRKFKLNFDASNKLFQKLMVRKNIECTKLAEKIK